MYFLTVLEATSLKSRCHQGFASHRLEERIRVCLLQLWGAPGTPLLVATSLKSLVFMWPSPFLSLNGHPPTPGFRVHSNLG